LPVDRKVTEAALMSANAGATAETLSPPPVPMKDSLQSPDWLARRSGQD
jgi:hypothetical protein